MVDMCKDRCPPSMNAPGLVPRGSDDPNMGRVNNDGFPTGDEGHMRPCWTRCGGAEDTASTFIDSEWQKVLLVNITPSGGIAIGYSLTQVDSPLPDAGGAQPSHSMRMVAQEFLLPMASEDIDNDNYDIDIDFEEGLLDDMEVLGAVVLGDSIGQISSYLLVDPMDAQQTMTQEEMQAFVDGLPPWPHPR